MYTYEIWDKKSPINEIDAEKILNDTPMFENSDVLLVYKNGIVTNIESMNIIKTFDFKYENMTNEEIAKDYVENLEITIQDRLSMIQEENQSLKESLKAILRGDMQTLAYNLYPEDFTEL